MCLPADDDMMTKRMRSLYKVYMYKYINSTAETDEHTNMLHIQVSNIHIAKLELIGMRVKKLVVLFSNFSFFTTLRLSTFLKCGHTSSPPPTYRIILWLSISIHSTKSSPCMSTYF